MVENEKASCFLTPKKGRGGGRKYECSRKKEIKTCTTFIAKTYYEDMKLPIIIKWHAFF